MTTTARISMRDLLIPAYTEAQMELDRNAPGTPGYRWAEAVIHEVVEVADRYDTLIVGDYSIGYKLVEVVR